MSRQLLIAVAIIAGIAIAARLWLGFKGFNITSWWRSPWHNKKVGGSPTSLHLIGWAFDIIPGGRNVASKVKDALPFSKVINEGDHVHVQLL